MANEDKVVNWRKFLKKTKLTSSQEKAIFKAKPQSGKKSQPSWAELGRKYGVPASEIQKGWANENIRNIWKNEKKTTKEVKKSLDKMGKINRVLDNLKGSKKTLKATRGGGSIASQFGSGKRGAEKLRASPFEVNRGGVIKRVRVKR